MNQVQELRRLRKRIRAALKTARRLYQEIDATGTFDETDGASEVSVQADVISSEVRAAASLLFDAEHALTLATAAARLRKATTEAAT